LFVFAGKQPGYALLTPSFPLAMPRKSFSELINSPGMPVLVDFYADWCGPCKTMAPILEQVASQHQGKLRIIKIDVDKNPAVAQQFKVQSIPTLILFSNGQPVWRQAGVVPAAQLGQAVSAHLR
jgi:thioredoxin 1